MTSPPVQSSDRSEAVHGSNVGGDRGRSGPASAPQGPRPERARGSDGKGSGNRDEPARRPDAKPDGYDDPPMTLWEHLDELRRRIIYAAVVWVGGCIVAWTFKEQLLSLLIQPFVVAWKDQNIGPEITLHFATPGAAFVSYLKLAMIGGTAIASPVIFYQLWRFIAPGLYAREKRFVIPFVLVSTSLFIGGGYFGWRAAFPVAFRYLLSLSGTVGDHGVRIVPTVMMGEYISFVSQLLLAFGFIFEIPVFIFFLSIAGIVNYLHLIHYARWFVVAAFVVAAFFTPPDVASQLMMALPMMTLYGGSIFVAMIFGKKPTPEQRAAFRSRGKKRSTPS